MTVYTRTGNFGCVNIHYKQHMVIKSVIIAIGDEVLSGAIVNRNAAWLSRQLLQLGWEVDRHVVIPDQRAVIQQQVAASIADYPLVIATGGLGPTYDDLTRDAVAELLHTPLKRHEAVADDLRHRYGEALISLEQQALVPEKAIVLRNRVGTAPGLLFPTEKGCVVLLPGVPFEMRTIFEEELIPYLCRHFVGQTKPTTLVSLFKLPESAVDPFLRTLDVECGIYPALGLLQVRLSDPDPFKLEKARERFVSQFRDHLYEPTGPIELAVQKQLEKRGETVAVAESCTGGAVAARFTRLPGISQVFLGGVVTYSNRLKEELLGVTSISAYGSVSRETVAQMAWGLEELMDADWALAVTGIAGPTGGTAEKPIGTVWCALKKRGSDPRVWPLLAHGSREMIIERSVNDLLATLYSQLVKIEQ